MNQFKNVAKVLLFSSLLSIGFGIGLNNEQSAHADNSTDLEHQENMLKSNIPTNDQTDDEFTTELTSSADLTQPIKDIFPDKVLANSVAKSLSGGRDNLTVNSKLTDSTQFTSTNPLSLNIYPIDGSNDKNPLLIKNWTGMSVFQNRIASLEVNDQGDDFNNKALIALKYLAIKNISYDDEFVMAFSGDGITQTTFDDIINYLNKDKSPIRVAVFNANYIHDFNVLNKIKFENQNNQSDDKQIYHSFHAANQFGAKHISNTFTVSKDGKINFTNQQLSKLNYMPTNPTSFRGVTYQDMFDTDDSRSVYTREQNVETPRFYQMSSPTLPITQESLIDYLNDVVGTQNVNDHLWSSFETFDSDGNPTYSATGQPKDSILSSLPQINSAYNTNIKDSDITAENNESGVTVSNISKDASSITLRTDLSDADSNINGYGNTIDIPIKHESDNASAGTTNSSSANNTSSTQTSTAKDTDTQTTGDGKTGVKKGQAVYALKKVRVHKTATFKKHSTKYTYAKQSRINRPQFVVTGYARSKTGLLRYKVRDVNHHSRHAGQTGYLTTNTKYVVNTYYKTTPKKIKVISMHGINSYKSIKLTGKLVRHYKKGAVLKIKKIKSHNLTTRLQLNNGMWITANKTLIIKK